MLILLFDVFKSTILNAIIKQTMAKKRTVVIIAVLREVEQEVQPDDIWYDRLYL